MILIVAASSSHAREWAIRRGLAHDSWHFARNANHLHGTNMYRQFVCLPSAHLKPDLHEIADYLRMRIAMGIIEELQP
jgi:hypothetical protein